MVQVPQPLDTTDAKPVIQDSSMIVLLSHAMLVVPIAKLALPKLYVTEEVLHALTDMF